MRTFPSLQTNEPFSQHTCTLEPIIKLGLSVDNPRARLCSCHLRFIANTASMIASEDPTVETPIASWLGLSTGAWKRRAMMLTQRFCRYFKYSMWKKSRMSALIRYGKSRYDASNLLCYYGFKHSKQACSRPSVDWCKNYPHEYVHI